VMENQHGLVGDKVFRRTNLHVKQLGMFGLLNIHGKHTAGFIIYEQQVTLLKTDSNTHGSDSLLSPVHAPKFCPLNSSMDVSAKSQSFSSSSPASDLQKGQGMTTAEIYVKLTPEQQILRMCALYC